MTSRKRPHNRTALRSRGRRRIDRALAALLVAAAPLLAHLTLRSQEPGFDGWATYQHDAQRTGRSSLPGPTAPDVAWSIPLRAADPVVGPDGRVWVMAVTPTSSGTAAELHAFEPDGTPSHYSTGLYGRFAGPVTIGPDGTIYAAVEHGIVAVAPDGTHEWSAPGSAPVVRDDGRLFTRRDCPFFQAQIVALNPDATEAWSTECGNLHPEYSVGGPAALTPTGDLLVILKRAVVPQTIVQLLDGDTGQQLWFAASISTGPPAIDEAGTVYFLERIDHSETSASRLRAVDVHGITKWESAPLGLTTHGPPAIDVDGSLVIGTNDYGAGGSFAIHRFSRLDGELIWSRSLGSMAGFATLTPMIDGNGRLFVGLAGGSELPAGVSAFHALDHAAGDLWTYESPAGITAIIGDAGTIYAVTGSSLIALRTEPPQAPAPSITEISPPSGPVSGGTLVTISGNDFVLGATVQFGDVAVAGSHVTFVDSSTLTVLAPPGDAGLIRLIVTNPDGQSAESTYTYQASPTLYVDGVSESTRFQGDAFSFEGHGFSAERTVTRMVRKDGIEQQLTPALSADILGNVAWVFLSPCDVPAGEYEVWVVDDVTGIRSNTVIEHIQQQANCRNTKEVTVNEIPVATSFRMPIGGFNGADVSLLTQAEFPVTHYPQIRFNDNGDHIADSNRTEWYVATAFNRNQWLAGGWDTDTTGPYRDFDDPNLTPDFHPGEDWNLNTGSNTDEGQDITAIGNGIVLFSGCGYGHTVIVAHQMSDGEIVTSFYGHMKSASPYMAGQVVHRGAKIGEVGRTVRYKSGKCDRSEDTQFSAHLHFELRKGHVCTSTICEDVTNGSMIEVKRDAGGLSDARSVVRLKFEAWMWPADHVAGELPKRERSNSDDGQSFIAAHYYSPSTFLLEHR